MLNVNNAGTKKGNIMK